MRLSPFLLNLAGTRRVPKALQPAIGRAAGYVESMGKVLNLGMSLSGRIGVDAAFTGGEAINCWVDHP
jgi:hypothetical protein